MKTEKHINIKLYNNFQLQEIIMKTDLESPNYIEFVNRLEREDSKNINLEKYLDLITNTINDLSNFVLEQIHVNKGRVLALEKELSGIRGFKSKFDSKDIKSVYNVLKMKIVYDLEETQVKSLDFNDSLLRKIGTDEFKADFNVFSKQMEREYLPIVNDFFNNNKMFYTSQEKKEILFLHSPFRSMIYTPLSLIFTLPFAKQLGANGLAIVGSSAVYGYLEELFLRHKKIKENRKGLMYVIKSHYIPLAFVDDRNTINVKPIEKGLQDLIKEHF